MGNITNGMKIARAERNAQPRAGKEGGMSEKTSVAKSEPREMSGETAGDSAEAHAGHSPVPVRSEDSRERLSSAQASLSGVAGVDRAQYGDVAASSSAGVERERWIRERAEEIVRIHAGCLMKCGLCQQTEDALVAFAHEVLFHVDDVLAAARCVIEAQAPRQQIIRLQPALDQLQAALEHADAARPRSGPSDERELDGGKTIYRIEVFRDVCGRYASEEQIAKEAAEQACARLRSALEAVVETARPAFPGSPFRKALDNARAALAVPDDDVEKK